MNPKIRDLPGLVVGRLRPIEPLPTVIGRKTVWRCACACGRSAFVRQDHLVKGRTQSCGCLVRLDFHGQQIGHLRVLQPGPNVRHPSRRVPSGLTRWVCRCRCGRQVLVRTETLARYSPNASWGCAFHAS